MKKIAPFMVLLAGILWGSNGIFVRLLADSGLNSFERAAIKVSIAAFVGFVLIYITDRKKLQVDRQDLIWFMLAGAFGIFGFNVAYTACINLVGMGTASVLIYLMPAIVTIYSCLFLKEKFTAVKGLSLILNLAGCALVSGILSDSHFDLMGVLAGIFTAFCYASLNIMISTRLKKYDALTRTFYPTLGAAICSFVYVMLFSEHGKIITVLSSRPQYILICTLWALTNAVCTCYLINTALNYIDVVKVSMLSTFEPVAAVLFGTILFKEKIDIYGIIGVIMVVISLIIPELKKKDTE